MIRRGIYTGSYYNDEFGYKNYIRFIKMGNIRPIKLLSRFTNLNYLL